MKTEELPSVTPTSRTFTPGIIPQTVFEAQNGATSFVRFGNVPIKSKLRLTYRNIDEETAYKFAAKYNFCITTNQGIRISEKNKAVSDVKDPMLMGELARGEELSEGLRERLSVRQAQGNWQANHQRQQYG